MDEETQAALELTKEELLAMREAGMPGRVARRPRDLNQLAASVVADATGPRPVSEGLQVPTDLSSFTVEDVKIEEEAQRFQLPVSAGSG